MYEAHFGLKTAPFSLAPDTEKFVSLQGHQECFDLLVYALSTGEGFIKVIGDVGTGKTILCRKLLRYLQNPSAEDSHSKSLSFQALYIPNPLLSPIGLLRALAHELDISLNDESASDMLLEQISAAMLKVARQQKSVVVIIDEAQALPEETLEALRLLTNLETENRKLVQVVLFAQPELDVILDQYKFRQLKQRITFNHYLNPLSMQSVEHYIEHRLIKAGYGGHKLFLKHATKKLFQYSKGVPRLINVLAHKAMLAAYSRGHSNITGSDVHLAWRDNQAEKNKPKSAKLWWVLVPSLLLSTSLLLAWLQWQQGLLL